MPSAYVRRVIRLGRNINAWLLIILLIGASAGGVINSGAQNSKGSPLPPYYVFRNSKIGPLPPDGTCQGCPTPCEPTPYDQDCNPNGFPGSCGPRQQGWKFYKPSLANCKGCQPDAVAQTCTYPTAGWGSYFAWSGHRQYAPLPLIPYYHTSNMDWQHTAYRFQGSSQHTTFSVSGPVKSVDPYSYSIEVQLDNVVDQDLIMELTIEAPGQMLIAVSGMGSIREVDRQDNGACDCAGSWFFVLPAFHNRDTGLRIKVNDPSHLQQSYILSGDIAPLQAA